MVDNLSPESPEDVSALSFEAAFLRLEETAQTLEAGNLTLEEATRLYEDGMKLAHHCNVLISATQLKISQLRKTYDAQEPVEEAEEDTVA